MAPEFTFIGYKYITRANSAIRHGTHIVFSGIPETMCIYVNQYGSLDMLASKGQENSMWLRSRTIKATIAISIDELVLRPIIEIRIGIITSNRSRDLLFTVEEKDITRWHAQTLEVAMNNTACRRVPQYLIDLVKQTIIRMSQWNKE